MDDDAIVNISHQSIKTAPINPLTRASFARVKSTKLPPTPPQPPTSQPLPPKAGVSLEWTDSRKLLEAAIMFEQIQPDQFDPSHYRRNIASQEDCLRSRLWSLGLDMVVQMGDGNCQFRSLSYSMFGTPEYHAKVRQLAVNYITTHRPLFEVFLGQDFRQYVRSMSQNGCWGDELTLRAVCETYGIVINVVTSDATNWFLRYIPEHNRMMITNREVFLSYIAPVHYNAIRRFPRGAAPFLRTMSSLGRKNSRVVATLDEYEKTKGIPTAPLEVLS